MPTDLDASVIFDPERPDLWNSPGAIARSATFAIYTGLRSISKSIGELAVAVDGIRHEHANLASKFEKINHNLVYVVAPALTKKGGV